SHRRRNPLGAEWPLAKRIVHFALRVGEPPHVFAERTRGVEQCGERRQVRRAGVQAQEIEPYAFERGDALGEMRGRGVAPGREYRDSVGAGRRERSDHFQLGARFGGSGLERGDGRRKFGELFTESLGQRREELRCGYAQRRFSRAKYASTHGARPLRRAESPGEPRADPALPEAITDPRLPPLTDARRDELYVERVAHRAERQRAEDRREQPRDRRSILVDRSLSEQHQSDGKPARRAEHGHSKNPVARRFLVFARECFALGTLATRDLERGAQIGERLPGAELAAALIDVK